MRIATWNINGVKARIPVLERWLREHSPDVAVLQEIKVVDEAFPRLEIETLGYNVETYGQKSWNGVAILSKLPFDEVHRGLPGDDADEHARLIEGVFSVQEGVVRVCGIYLPNGNPIGTDKFTYKLGWMDRLHAFVEGRLAQEEPFILLGDFNIIPMPLDARHPEKWTRERVDTMAPSRPFPVSFPGGWRTKVALTHSTSMVRGRRGRCQGWHRAAPAALDLGVLR